MPSTLVHIEICALCVRAVSVCVRLCACVCLCSGGCDCGARVAQPFWHRPFWPSWRDSQRMSRQRAYCTSPGARSPCSSAPCARSCTSAWSVGALGLCRARPVMDAASARLPWGRVELISGMPCFTKFSNCPDDSQTFCYQQLSCFRKYGSKCSGGFETNLKRGMPVIGAACPPAKWTRSGGAATSLRPRRCRSKHWTGTRSMLCTSPPSAARTSLGR